MSATGRSVAGRSATSIAVGSKQASVSEKAKERSYAVVVRAKDESVKLTSEEVKDKVMRNVSADLNIRSQKDKKW